MKKIKIVVGTYGYRKDETSPVDLIDKNSKPIEVPNEEAARLIELGVAEEVVEGAEVKTATPTPEPEFEGTATPAPDTAMVTGHLDAESLKEYSYNDLKRLAKELGLSTKGKTEELIERIAAANVQAPAEDDGPETEDDEPSPDATNDEEADDEKPPVLTAVDPE